ncbi:MAG: Hsp20/alpha crystallin family protein [Candidatus Magasanikbacteria bacterium]|uniref:Hsp20/alpha crystallin family protein n=1 Tax=Candidatus Magasanikbacteria bacterium CG10_big_fil_rev_8_21_14_0_10_38_6 TaxID=1974647 RepID=A0A2M6P107_9BACT|nr:Hsp20/alpha crystallin family protein [Candidatus Magasanikbacteria bacterium]NCS72112.1 Hsp20/alpha crystallin family protein [Candidatus Magasanikbacteria bacterium]PIR77090.1 MAG: Hsp20/alpha crystallin family protein [Candidatus Magasanikbacteria bacterium CG10_big_fil_rev_8_21_14_0_10_38_6]
MSIIRYNPNWDPFQEMEDMMSNLPAMRQMKSMVPVVGFTPAIDMYETEDAVKVETSLPGINPKNVEVSIEKGLLSIQGTVKKEHEVDDKNYYRKEMRSGSFFRQLSLPVPVKEDQVTAEFEDGLLKITLPKQEPTKGKKVQVKVVKKKE